MSDEELFGAGGLHSFETKKKDELIAEINKLDDKSILNANPDELGEQLARRYQLKPLALKDDKKYIRTPEYSPGARSHSFQLLVPYEGNPNLFRYKPRQFINPDKPIRAQIISDVIILNYSRPDYDAKALKDLIDQHMKSIRENLELTNAQVQLLNDSLLEEARSTIAGRKANLQKRQALIKDLNIPFRE